MANNRLYLVDTETKDRFLLAKGFGGWERPAMHQPTAVFDWLLQHDVGGACSIGGPTTLRLMTESEVDALDKPKAAEDRIDLPPMPYSMRGDDAVILPEDVLEYARAAVLAERARCAAVADRFDGLAEWTLPHKSQVLAQEIAAAIRKG